MGPAVIFLVKWLLNCPILSKKVLPNTIEKIPLCRSSKSALYTELYRLNVIRRVVDKSTVVLVDALNLANLYLLGIMCTRLRILFFKQLFNLWVQVGKSFLWSFWYA